jgi:hypothetical protein
LNWKWEEEYLDGAQDPRLTFFRKGRHGKDFEAGFPEDKQVGVKLREGYDIPKLFELR